MSETQTTTRIRTNDGRFATIKNLFKGNGQGQTFTIDGVGGDDIQAVLKEARRAAFERAVEKGKRLLLEATRVTKQGDPARALETVKADRYACAAYLAREASKRMKRFVRVSSRDPKEPSGFGELELMEQFWRGLIEASKVAAEGSGKKP